MGLSQESGDGSIPPHLAVRLLFAPRLRPCGQAPSITPRLSPDRASLPGALTSMSSSPLRGLATLLFDFGGTEELDQAQIW